MSAKWTGIGLLIIVLNALGVHSVNVTSESSAPLNSTGSTVKYFIVLMMENRSFDHMLGWLKEIDENIDGLTGDEYNLVDIHDPNSERIYVQKGGYDVAPDDPNHDFENTSRQIYGHLKPERLNSVPVMNGFVQNAAQYGFNTTNVMNMFTIEPDSAPILNTLALEYAVIDHWYSSLPGPTDPNRAFFMSGTSNGMITNFNGTLWSQQSYFDFLTQHNVSWNAYFEDDPWAIMYFNDTHLPQNRKHIHFLDAFYEKLKNGNLASFSLLQPRMQSFPAPPSWQHPDASVKEGERLIKKIYEAIRNSSYWNETAFLIIYDEHGGFYDSVPPVQTGVPPPDGVKAKNGFDFTRLGIRVPAVLISPLVAKHTVVKPPQNSTSQFDHTSVIATANSLFGITEQLTNRTAWAATLNHLFQTQPRGDNDCIKVLPELPPYTDEESKEQWAKPLNDHMKIQVEFYCKFNKREKDCGRGLTNQLEASKFLAAEVDYFLKYIVPTE